MSASPATAINPWQHVVRRLLRCWWFWTFIAPAVALVLPVVIHNGLMEYRCRQIRAAGGGGVSFGSPPTPYELEQKFRLPISRLCRWKPVAWYREQFPVAYGVNLRGVRDPEDVEKALDAAKHFPYLLKLDLYQSAVRDEHLERLAIACPRLTHLLINETEITDRGMQHLRNMRWLELVNVQRTAITDESVAVLADLPRLKELAVGETGITSVDAIRARRPMCRIHTTLLYATRCPVCRQLLNECRCRKDQATSGDEG